MIPALSIYRKLLEKQVQNHFDSYEVHTGHFFYIVNRQSTVSFTNRLILFILKKIFTELTEGQNLLFYPFMYAHAR